MARGATHVFPEPGGFAARPFYELVAKLGVTSCQMVPTQIQTLLDSPPTGEDDLSTLKTIGYGAAPMYVDRLKEAITIFGPIFTQTYGLGEAPRGITCLPKRDHVVRDADSERRLGSVGRECLYVQVRTVDDEGHAMPTGTEGEVAVKGELITKGYWNNAAATEELIRDGWLYTGDIGYFDEAGYLFLTDRKKDVIITGGSNVYPREVEEVLYRHPAVQEACVVGEPDKRWGERITAAIVRRVGEEISEISIADWCKSQIASYKKPSRVVFLESLPKSSVGKILRREVQRLIRDLEAQQQSSRNCPMDSNT
jgi:acyl-CoA synthetase (AMP-forming)/AMP-acid ligase II